MTPPTTLREKPRMILLPKNLTRTRKTLVDGAHPNEITTMRTISKLKQMPWKKKLKRSGYSRKDCRRCQRLTLALTKMNG
jgi:hypothetical protein